MSFNPFNPRSIEEELRLEALVDELWHHTYRDMIVRNMLHLETHGPSMSVTHEHADNMLKRCVYSQAENTPFGCY